MHLLGSPCSLLLCFWNNLSLWDQTACWSVVRLSVLLNEFSLWVHTSYWFLVHFYVSLSEVPCVPVPFSPANAIEQSHDCLSTRDKAQKDPKGLPGMKWSIFGRTLLPSLYYRNVSSLSCLYATIDRPPLIFVCTERLCSFQQCWRVPRSCLARPPAHFLCIYMILLSDGGRLNDVGLGC